MCAKISGFSEKEVLNYIDHPEYPWEKFLTTLLHL
jgi:hypothetical protein